MKPSVHRFICGVFFLIALGLWLWGINYPYVGIYNANNNYLSLAVKNYFRFGFIRLNFAPTYYAGSLENAHIDYYLHHPILMYLIAGVPYKIFGFQNWVVHAATFIFLIGSIYMIYKIGIEVWHKRLAFWAAALAAIFPMTSFFWKYMFFEQISLFFTLLIVYNFLCLIRLKENKYLLNISIFSFLAALSDWGVLYLAFPMMVFLLSKNRQMLIKAFFVYGLGAGLGLGSFIFYVHLLKGGLTDLFGAILNRTATAELTSLAYWPVRLFLLSLIRIIFYFTPLAIWCLVYFIKKIKRKPYSEKTLLLLFFFIYGTLNLVFLPTATWGHSYFLFYYLPFYAYTGSLILSSLTKYKLIFITLVIIVCSIAVNYLKITQVAKQLWKYDVAVEINKSVIPYETLGILNFSGDVFENYFFHPSQLITENEVIAWANRNIYPSVNKLVFNCEGICTSDEFKFVNSLSKIVNSTNYTFGIHNAWVFDREKKSLREIYTTRIITSEMPQVNEQTLFIRLYRLLRDLFQVGQI